jgi:hypothetical protein
MVEPFFLMTLREIFSTALASTFSIESFGVPTPKQSVVIF